MFPNKQFKLMKADAINKFIKFYTSLRLRKQYAEAKDLKNLILHVML